MRIALFLLAAFVAVSSSAADKQLLWGDTHLHTSYSFDAYTNNNFTADPNVAYRYARGEPVVHPYNRTRVQIETPLDFLVVSDHAEFLGVIRHIHQQGVDTSELGLWDSLKARFAAWYLKRRLDQRDAAQLFRDVLPPPKPVREAAVDSTVGGNTNLLPDMMPVQFDTWHSQTELADEYYQPGQFSTFIGWEWSSTPGGANLHRVVFTDGDAKVGQSFHPFRFIDSQYPEDLWAWLDDTSAATGANFMSIPHNSNLSKGFMFDDTRLRGTELDSAWIELRRKWEPVTEVTQLKGDSETHPDLSPDDEFADFETFPFYLQVNQSPYKASVGDYMRSALMRGLALEQQYGANPYQFGVIGSTDAHTGIASAEEDNFWGKMATDSIPENKSREWEPGIRSPDGWAMSASGLAAVWAEENTREGIMAAMKRREVYATTGPRIRLQFYGAADFGELDLASADLYAQATRVGTPMGGELTGGDSAPEFIILADRDPVGANLDRIQVVKGWLDAGGQPQERIYNVSWSGERELDAAGKLPAVGNTVDMANGEVRNSIGAPQLSARWSDPDYVAGQPAFYYVRVLQIPTARHSYLDALALGREQAQDHPNTIQERAYSSPIWLKPSP
ncbi:MAG: DUF3604 domain-containing protein [Halieaceae bacterium]|jgi:hypothetical protein|nr:DUF3604 domain-containing protein [Halieaceae bacterium]